VRLTRAEIALLTAFVDSPRRVLSRDQLRYAVAGRGAEPYDRSVDMLVSRLRRKISACSILLMHTSFHPDTYTGHANVEETVMTAKLSTKLS
jgi:DNA-binding response OmpR family regulator